MDIDAIAEKVSKIDQYVKILLKCADEKHETTIDYQDFRFVDFMVESLNRDLNPEQYLK